MAKKITLNLIKQEEKSLYVKYLLLADESKEVVNTYMNDGEMFAIQIEETIAGVVLFVFYPDNVVELKNIALASSFRGNGVGKLVINEAFEIYKKRGMNKMTVGTANSSIGNLAFYQKVGFRMAGIKKDFFKKYPEPIFEDGIRALDMVMFEMDLTEPKENAE